MSEKTTVLKPRSQFDRTLARLEQQRIWEHTPAAIDMEISIVNRAMLIAENPDATLTQQTRALLLAHKVLKETFIDRTIPIVHRIEAAKAMNMLPTSEDEASQAGDPVQVERTAMREALRKLAHGRLQLVEGGPPSA